MTANRLRKRARKATSAQKPATGPLHDARTRLGDAVAALVDARPAPTEQGTRYTDGLYEQLRAALYSPNPDNRSAGAPTASLPLWVDAHDTLAAIDHRVGVWEPRTMLAAACPDCGATPAHAAQTVLRLRALTARKWRPQDTKMVHDTAAEIEAWAREIGRLFDPQPKYLPDPCPRCNERIVRRHTNSGVAVRIPALEITMKGCICQNCGATWTPDKLPLLGRILGYPAPDGVIDE